MRNLKRDETTDKMNIKIKSVHHNDNTDRAPHKTNSNSTKKKILSPTFNWHFILGFMFATDGKTNRITKEKRVYIVKPRYDREHRKRDALYQAARFVDSSSSSTTE